jgi:hypothetical protein
MVTFRNKFIYLFLRYHGSLLTTDECATHLRLSERTLYELGAERGALHQDNEPLACSGHASRPW